LKKNNIPFITVSRTTEINYQNLTENQVLENLIIIQCTPVGTFPNVEEILVFPFENITENHLVIDLIYNPTLSKFLKNALSLISTQQYNTIIINNKLPEISDLVSIITTFDEPKKIIESQSNISEFITYDEFIEISINEQIIF
jgi:hypothetical protein